MQTKFKGTAGFTLAELLIASSISLAVIIAALSMLVFGVKASLTSSASIQNDLEQLGINSNLRIDSRLANSVYVYGSLNQNDIQLGTRDKGNLLILAKSQDPQAGSVDAYTSLTAYHYNSQDHTIKICRIDLIPAAGPAYPTLEQIIIMNLSNINQNLSTLVAGVEPLMATNAVFSSLESKTAAQLVATTSVNLKVGAFQSKKIIQASFYTRKG